jgi:hypothetical protein
MMSFDLGVVASDYRLFIDHACYLICSSDQASIAECGTWSSYVQRYNMTFQRV